MRRSLAEAVGYLAIMTLWLYAVANRWDSDSGTWQLPVLIIVQLVAGFAVGRWWAALLPVVVVFVSMPAGYPPITPEYAEPLPIWVGLAVAAPVGCLLVAIGVATRKLLSATALARARS